jgi:DNA-3-methyladenine glycosylase II
MAWLDNKNPGGKPLAQNETRLAADRLSRQDRVLRRLIREHGPCTLEPSRAYFNVLLEAVISQQLSTHAAKAIYNRMVVRFGNKPPCPSDVLAVREDELIAMGFSRSKVAYVRNVAGAFRTRRLGPARFARMSDDEVVGFLTSIRGIGEWSAHMFLIFALGRMDVLPLGDLGLRSAMAKNYRLEGEPPLDVLRRIADRWRPYRTIGTWYLWESYDNA